MSKQVKLIILGLLILFAISILLNIVQCSSSNTTKDADAMKDSIKTVSQKLDASNDSIKILNKKITEADSINKVLIEKLEEIEKVVSSKNRNR